MRLFLAVWPPTEVVTLLRRLERTGDDGVRWTPPERLHITLRFIGEAHPDEITDRMAVIRLPRAHAQLGPKVERLGHDALVLPVAGLEPLEQAVRAALGPGTDERPFVGHLTLGRLRSTSDSAEGSETAVLPMACSAAFDVAGVALVASVLGPEGPSYETLASWPTEGS